MYQRSGASSRWSNTCARTSIKSPSQAGGKEQVNGTRVSLASLNPGVWSSRPHPLIVIPVYYPTLWPCGVDMNLSVSSVQNLFASMYSLTAAWIHPSRPKWSEWMFFNIQGSARSLLLHIEEPDQVRHKLLSTFLLSSISFISIPLSLDRYSRKACIALSENKKFEYFILVTILATCVSLGELIFLTGCFFSLVPPLKVQKS